MKHKILYFAAMLAVMIGVAPAPAHAKTQRQRIAALEKAVKKQSQTIKALTSLALEAQARAVDAQQSYSFLVGCLSAQTAGPASVLADSTTTSFVQGDATLGIADVFQWFPQPVTVIAPVGDFYLTLLDPSCVAQPTPAGRAHRNGWDPRPLVLR